MPSSWARTFRCHQNKITLLLPRNLQHTQPFSPLKQQISYSQLSQISIGPGPCPSLKEDHRPLSLWWMLWALPWEATDLVFPVTLPDTELDISRTSTRRKWSRDRLWMFIVTAKDAFSAILRYKWGRAPSDHKLRGSQWPQVERGSWPSLSGHHHRTRYLYYYHQKKLILCSQRWGIGKSSCSSLEQDHRCYVGQF